MKRQICRIICRGSASIVHNFSQFIGILLGCFSQWINQIAWNNSLFAGVQYLWWINVAVYMRLIINTYTAVRLAHPTSPYESSYLLILCFSPNQQIAICLWGRMTKSFPSTSLHFCENSLNELSNATKNMHIFSHSNQQRKKYAPFMPSLVLIYLECIHLGKSSRTSISACLPPPLPLPHAQLAA